MGEKEEGEKVTFRAESMCWGGGYEKCHGTGRVSEYSLKKAEIRRECRKLRLLYYRKSERFFLFSEFRGNVFGLKMKSPTLACIVLCAVHPVSFLGCWDQWFKNMQLCSYTIFLKRKYKTVKQKRVKCQFCSWNSHPV